LYAETGPKERAVLSTYVSYQVIMRDLPRALDRVEKQPTVSRETDYYLENITKVNIHSPSGMPSDVSFA